MADDLVQTKKKWSGAPRRHSITIAMLQVQFIRK